jgi:anaerobic ribonucleoside-triphosphate reductase activating protein
MRYHNITKDDMLNGEGLRVVLWVAGCIHGCKSCHNTLTWNPNGGILFDEGVKQELFDALNKSYISGITFSGGDPLHPNNIMDIEALAKEIKDTFPQKTIWLYTGDVWNTIKDYSILKYLDIIIDGKFEIEKKDTNLCWRGSANQRIIDVQKTLNLGSIALYAE